jgi:hypothetical protein
MMDHEAEQIIQRELASDERLLWSGCPQKGILFRWYDILLIPFSLLWGGFAIFWEVKVIQTGGPFFLILWGIPFVLIGLQITIGRFIVDAKIRASTYYGVTNRSVIIISGLVKRKILSCDLKSLRELSFSEIMNRKGSISFGAENPHSSWLQNMPFGQTDAPQFEMVENARDIFEIIRHAKEMRHLQ